MIALLWQGRRRISYRASHATTTSYSCSHYLLAVLLIVLLCNGAVSAVMVDKDDGVPRFEKMHDTNAQVTAVASPSSSSPSLSPMERGAAPVVSPASFPTPAPFVMSFGPQNQETTASPSRFTFTNSLGCVETLTAESPSETGAGGNSAGDNPSETWIRIAGILVPAIVAIGLGIGGFLVTLHVNRRNPDDQDDWRN